MSQHPIDRLIRELIRTRREATTEEVEWIIRRMATAPFDRRVLPVPPPLRGLTYQGITLGERADALFRHTVQRVVDEKQWADGTTQNEYLDDLSRAVLDPSARLAIYERRGGNIAAVFAPNVVPEDRKGAGRLDYIFVVHSSDRGTIISGYQVSGLSEVSIPRGTKWLR